MAHASNANGTVPASPAPPPIPPATKESSVRVGLSPADPNMPPSEEAEAATFPTSAEVEATVADLVAAGVIRDSIVVIPGTVEKRDFMKRYVHRDGDRHTHAGTAPPYFAVIGALVMGALAVAIASPFDLGTWGLLAVTLGGGLVGVALAGILGGFAMRPADDKSMEIVESVAADGILVAVRRPIGSGRVPLDEVGRILARHNGRVLRLHRHLSQADLHPGDTRPDQMWTSDVERH